MSELKAPINITMQLMEELLEDLQDSAVDFGVKMIENRSFDEQMIAHDQFCINSEKLRNIIEILVKRYNGE